MAAADRILDAAFLQLVGLDITEPLHKALLGRTIAQATALLEDLLPMVLAAEAAGRGAVNSYTINGRSIGVSPDLIDRALTVLRARMSASNGGGPVTLRVRL